MGCNNTISTERLDLIHESALRQFRSGRSFDKVLVNLYVRGLEEAEAETVAKKAYAQYLEEQKRQFEKSYEKPLLGIPCFLKSFAIKMISFVLSMVVGHFINIERFIKRDEKRVQ